MPTALGGEQKWSPGMRMRMVENGCGWAAVIWGQEERRSKSREAAKEWIRGQGINGWEMKWNKRGRVKDALQ
jgi:hypothetical protein